MEVVENNELAHRLRRNSGKSFRAQLIYPLSFSQIEQSHLEVFNTNGGGQGKGNIRDVEFILQKSSALN